LTVGAGNFTNYYQFIET